MDKVRLGRALGYGTRHAAKTLAAVADAATAPNPRGDAGPGTRAAAPEISERRGDTPPLARRVQVPSAKHVKQAGRSFWGPLAAFSGALTLRVTGVFFGVIALAMLNGAWRVRAAVLSPGPARGLAQHFWLFAGFGLLFLYFAVSSFVRARERERRLGA